MKLVKSVDIFPRQSMFIYTLYFRIFRAERWTLSILLKYFQGPLPDWWSGRLLATFIAKRIRQLKFGSQRIYKIQIIQISELWNLIRQFHIIIDYSFSFRFERDQGGTLLVEPKSAELNTVQLCFIFRLYFDRKYSRKRSRAKNIFSQFSSQGKVARFWSTPPEWCLVETSGFDRDTTLSFDCFFKRLDKNHMHEVPCQIWYWTLVFLACLSPSSGQYLHPFQTRNLDCLLLSWTVLFHRLKDKMVTDWSNLFDKIINYSIYRVALEEGSFWKCQLYSTDTIQVEKID